MNDRIRKAEGIEQLVEQWKAEMKPSTTPKIIAVAGVILVVLVCGVVASALVLLIHWMWVMFW